VKYTQGVSSMAEHVRGLAGTDVGVTATEPYRVFLWVMLHRMEQSLRCVNKQLRSNQAILDHPKSNNVLVNLVCTPYPYPNPSPGEPRNPNPGEPRNPNLSLSPNPGEPRNPNPNPG